VPLLLPPNRCQLWLWPCAAGDALLRVDTLLVDCDVEVAGPLTRGAAAAEAAGAAGVTRLALRATACLCCSKL